MADINLTSGNDVYVQPESDRYVWNHIHGLQGADTIRLFQGIAIGGQTASVEIGTRSEF